MPRHPPYALNNLTTKMLASTVQFSNTTPDNHFTREHHIQDHPGRFELEAVPVTRSTTRKRVLPQDPTVCQPTHGKGRDKSSSSMFLEQPPTHERCGSGSPNQL